VITRAAAIATNIIRQDMSLSIARQYAIASIAKMIRNSPPKDNATMRVIRRVSALGRDMSTCLGIWRPYTPFCGPPALKRHDITLNRFGIPKSIGF
jgi:hypothetical protein